MYLLQHTITHWAAADPGRVAFCYRGQLLTYDELARRSNQLARLLASEGLERGDRIGIYLPRCLHTPVAIYGTLMAGAAFVPLDPDAPPARTRRLIEDCGIRHLLTAPALRRKLPEVLAGPTPVRTLIGADAPDGLRSYAWSALDAQPPTDPGRRILSDDLAYIMYTSGSTGEPKGIMHTHRSGLAYARLSAGLYGLKSTDRVANHCALHYDISTFGYFSAMLAGATTVIVSDAHTKLPTSLLQLVEEERITLWYSVPLVLIQMVQSSTLAERDLSALRWVLFGGEVLAPRHLRRLMAAAPNARASNVYGPAEVNQCTYRHFDRAPRDDAPLPLGWVWDDTDVRIIDANDRPVPPGGRGELLVRSATMMRGYWRRPYLNRQAFYEETDEGGFVRRFYRTGDVVYCDAATGELHFVGRHDRQVKVRGHRVELGEVEAALAALAGVGEAAVYLATASGNVRNIEALVVGESEAEAQPEAWRRQLARELPAHAVPQKIHLVSALPRNDAGKIDRLAIDALAATQV